MKCPCRRSRLTGDRLPNIVIIYTDDHGYGDVGAYGATALKTPNIDRLAEGGVPPHSVPSANPRVNIEVGNAPDYQLYRLSTDIGQLTNLAQSEPEKLQNR